jgi:hypothetical protein
MRVDGRLADRLAPPNCAQSAERRSTQLFGKNVGKVESRKSRKRKRKRKSVEEERTWLLEREEVRRCSCAGGGLLLLLATRDEHLRRCARYLGLDVPAWKENRGRRVNSHLHVPQMVAIISQKKPSSFG